MTWQEDAEATISTALALLLDVPDNAETHEAALNASQDLARLTAALERRTEELAVANELDDEHRRHAEAFEQRVAELEAALRKILEPFPNAPMPKYEDIRRIARAALREGDEK